MESNADSTKSDQPVCLTQPNYSADKTQVIGSTVFVYTDCGTNERLPMEVQDPAYNHPGVPLPQAKYAAQFQTCNCQNEDGCTPDSPSCCGEGSCAAGSGVLNAKSKVRKA